MQLADSALLGEQTKTWSMVRTLYDWYQSGNFNIFSTLSNVFFGTGVTMFTIVTIVSTRLPWQPRFIHKIVSSFMDFFLGFAVFIATLYYLLESEDFFLDRLVTTVIFVIVFR